jgi:DNA-binding MarR family transcriptional regulator
MDHKMTKPIGFLIKKISGRMEAQGNNALKKYGLTYTQSRVLASLEMHGGRLTQKELESELGVSHPTVVGIVNRLERDGFVHCWQDESDRRVKNIESTAKAEQVAASLDWMALNDENALMTAFSEEEQAELIRLLTKLERQLEKNTHTEGGIDNGKDFVKKSAGI